MTGPKYNRLVNDEHAGSAFAVDGRDGKRGASGNPWLTTLATLGVLTLIFGVIVWATAIGERYDDAHVPDALLAGLALTLIGTGLLTAWLVASAVCWQIKQPPAE